MTFVIFREDAMPDIPHGDLCLRLSHGDYEIVTIVVGLDDSCGL
jgi:hypothetical protein